MNLFGLTSVDAALNLAGLNFTHILMDYIFRRSGIGLVVGGSVFLLSLWRYIRTGHFNLLISFFSIIIVLVLMLLPSFEQKDISSYQELNDKSFRSSKSLKNSITSIDRVPVFFTFISRSVDQVFFAIISLMDKSMSVEAKFLPKGYFIETQSAYIREASRVGFLDSGLSYRFKSFIDEQYAPVLSRYKIENSNQTLGIIGPGHKNILELYPAYAEKQWVGSKSLSALCDKYLESNQYLRRDARAVFLPFLDSHNDNDVKQCIMASFAQHNILKSSQGIEKICSKLLYWSMRALPYIHGVAQMTLSILFPFVVLSLFIDVQPGMFREYCRNLIWIKSWVLSAAISHYTAILVAQAQTQVVLKQEVSWAWEQPFFVGAFLISLLFQVLLTRMLIFKGG